MFCKTCFESTSEIANAHGYDLTEEQIGDLLVNCTCFPAGGVEDVRPQVEEFFGMKVTDSSKPTFNQLLHANMARCDSEMEQAMASRPTETQT